MKKIVMTLAFICLFILGFGLTNASAETYEYLTYTIIDDEISITDCSYSARNVVIPETIDGHLVTSIGDAAFKDCYYLKSVVIPDSVTSIGYQSFQHCDYLESITIPKNLASIGGSAFNMCYNLTSIPIPNSVTSIGNSAFANCNKLTSITIPEGITSIETHTFSFCTSLTNINIPSSVTFIDRNAFDYCYSLTSIVIPDGVTSIEQSTFSNCEALRTLTIPKSVTSIGYGAFKNCYNISNIYYGGNSTDWSKITFGSYNTELDDAYFIYDYKIPKTYTFVVNGGSKIDKITTGEIVSSPVTEKEDNKFIGWYDNAEFNGEKITFPYSGEKTTLYAKWKPIVYLRTSILSETAENTVFKVVPINLINSAMVIFASYNDGRLTYTESSKYNSEEYLTFKLNKNCEYDIIKVFAWAGIDKLMPLCKYSVYCGNSQDESDHILGEKEIDILPTCNKTGKYKDRYCQTCARMFIGEEIPALGHTEVIDASVTPTCTKTGLTEGKHCSVCNAIIIKQNVVPRASHTEVADKRVEPTCTTVGYDGGTHCSVCGLVVKEQVEISALGHTEVIDISVAPTCTKTGLTEGKHCSVCNEIIVLQQEVDKVPHAIKNGRCINCYASKDVLKSEELLKEAERHKAKIEEINDWYAWIVDLNQSRISALKDAHGITYVYDDITCIEEINAIQPEIYEIERKMASLSGSNAYEDKAELARLESEKSSLESKIAKYEAMKDINAYEQALLSHQDTYNERIEEEIYLYEKNKEQIELKYK